VAPARIGPVSRAAVERWLRSNGLPACIKGHSRPRAVLRRPISLIACLALLLIADVALVIVTELPLGVATGIPAVGATLILEIALAYAMTAVGLPELAVFTVTWFVRSAWRSASGLTHVLPLLLVAGTPTHPASHPA
jgi:hypothetical protein